MGKQHCAFAAAANGSVCYRITPKGRGNTPGNAQLRSRYLIDLLDLMETSGRDVREWELRQFMPPASLEESINTLLELGLIECGAKTYC